MPKPLPSEDFRATRIVLEPDDFALGSEQKDPSPSDLIDAETWHGIVTLPDDVAIRTSNHHGSVLKRQHDLWGAWLEIIGEEQDFLYTVMLDANDELQAAIFNALHGYYRQAISCFRNALEQVVIGAELQIYGDNGRFQLWETGGIEIKFQDACDRLAEVESIRQLEGTLRKQLNDSIFDRKTSTLQGGWARRLYGELSHYAHARPGFSSSDMWESNGPIYVTEALDLFTGLFTQTLKLNFLLIKLGRSAFSSPKAFAALLLATTGQDSVSDLIAKACFIALFHTKSL